MSHWLVIREQGEDYDIEHEESCPQVELWSGPYDEPIYDYDCLVGWSIRESGLEILEVDWRTLEPGRYELEGWTLKHSAIPGIRSEEWDAGIDVKLGKAEHGS